MADASLLVNALRDADEDVRDRAEQAMWRSLIMLLTSRPAETVALAQRAAALNPPRSG